MVPRPTRRNKTATLQQVRVTEILFDGVMKCVKLSKMNYADWMRDVIANAVTNQCNRSASQQQEQNQ